MSAEDVAKDIGTEFASMATLGLNRKLFGGKSPGYKFEAANPNSSPLEKIKYYQEYLNRLKASNANRGARGGESVIGKVEQELGRLKVSQMFLNPQQTQSYQSAQAQLPGILQSIQSQMGARPTLNIPQMGQGSLLGNLSTHGAQMIRKGQTLNPTILKAKK